MEIQAYVWFAIIGILVLSNVKWFKENRVLGIAVLLGGIGISIVSLLTQILIKLDKLLLVLK